MIREINAIKTLLFANVLIIQIAKIVQRDHSAIQMIRFALVVYPMTIVLVLLILLDVVILIINVLNVLQMMIVIILYK